VKQVRQVTSFTAGELSPLLHARPDLAKYQSGVARLENMYVLPQGGAQKRMGWHHKTYHNTPFHLQAFTISAGRVYLLMFGEYELVVFTPPDDPDKADADHYVFYPSPYTLKQAQELSTVQSADVLFCAHPDVAPHKLSRVAEYIWQFTPIAFGASIASPQNLRTTNVVSGGTTQARFKVTAVDGNGRESLASDELILTGLAIYDDGKTLCALAWDGVSGARYYNVYQEKNGLFGWVARTEVSNHIAKYVVPDTGDTPPQLNNPFAGGNHPSKVAFFQQRLVFAGSRAQPETIWMSRTGEYDNFNLSSPMKDDDAIALTLSGAQVNRICHLVPMQDLLVFTEGAVWKISADGDGILSPRTVKLDVQGGQGSTALMPLRIGHSTLYGEAPAGRLRETRYSFDAAGYASRDVAILAAHLFQGRQVVQWGYAASPHGIIWALLDTGAMVAMTYLPDQDIWAWHQHPTDGDILSIAVIDEFQQSVLYACIQRRNAAGEVYTALERLFWQQERIYLDDARVLDAGQVVPAQNQWQGCALWAYGANTGQWQALPDVQEDGILYVPEMDGETRLWIGRPYTARLHTLPVRVGAVLESRRKMRLAGIGVHVYSSAGFDVAVADSAFAPVPIPDEDQTPWPQGTDKPPWHTGFLYRPVTADWFQKSVWLRQDAPLPLTILALEVDVFQGGA
jgi:hypothetical protein